MEVTSTVRTARGALVAPLSHFPISIANIVGKVYRGHEKCTRTGFVIGHEFTGIILSVGSGVKNFKKGDHVISPFTRY